MREFFIAKDLETHLTKNRIFWIYLNVIEWGRGIFGVGAAAHYYFKKPVEQLNLVEIIRLTAVIPKPLRVSPLSDSRYLKWRANWLLDHLYKYNDINAAQYRRAKETFSY